jgi:hypothetical protein
MTDRLNSKSILVCDLALRECGKEVLNDAKSLMNHFIEHGWKQIPQLAQEDIDEYKPHPKTKEVMTEKSYLEFIDKNPVEWWFDNQFSWVDIRNLQFLHKTSKGLRSLRMYYHG